MFQLLPIAIVASILGILLFAVLLFYIFNILGLLSGGPYSATPYQIVENLFKFITVGKKDVVYDLGSGDGRVLIEAAKHGAYGVGWEINYPLYVYSLRRVKRLKLDKKIKIHYGNFWKAKLKQATVIFAFLLPKFMQRLEKKLEKETSSGTLVITYKAKLPNRQATKISPDGLAVYYF